MLWYKHWLETRWRFLTGLAVLSCAAGAVVLNYPRVMELLPLASNIDLGGEIGRRVSEEVDLQRTYGGYIWSQWFRQTPLELGTFFALLLGTGGLISHASTEFTLSLPLSRRTVVLTRAASGLGLWLILAFVPSLLVPLLSPAVGQAYGVGEALAHSICLFVGGALFLSLAVLLSTIFAEVWRPLLVAGAVALAVGFGELLFRDRWPLGIFRVMSGEALFRTGSLPWAGLLVVSFVSAAMVYGATVSFSRRDF
jgi:hypothetical protein